VQKLKAIFSNWLGLSSLSDDVRLVESNIAVLKKFQQSRDERQQIYDERLREFEQKLSRLEQQRGPVRYIQTAHGLQLVE
jgi:hypothetical protein